MNKIVSWISRSMFKNGTILEEEQEIYNFGIECMILKGIHYISYITIALMMQQLFELLVMGCAFLPLRTSAGGYHAKTKIGCYIVSCFTVFIGLFLYKQGFGDKAYLICWIISSLIIYIIAPVDNENKVMSQSEVQVYSKKVKIIIILLGFVVVVSWICSIGYISKMLICGITVSAIAIIVGKFKRITGCSEKITQ